MDHAGLSIFPWDFADEGLDEVLGFVRDLGITRLVLASVYHAGFFIHPHNPKRKVHLLEDGVCYFHPTVIKFLRALVADLAEKYPLYSLLLEAPDYRRRKHGGVWVFIVLGWEVLSFPKRMPVR